MAKKPGPKPMNELDRFLRHVRHGQHGCWLWIGSKTQKGYPRFRVKRRTKRYMMSAHRWAYEYFIGSLSKTLEPDHLCRVKACVNPTHLEAVTRRTNVLRGESPPAHNARKTHCKNGHPFTGDNLVMYGGARQCRTCLRHKVKEQHRKRREEGLAVMKKFYEERRDRGTK